MYDSLSIIFTLSSFFCFFFCVCFLFFLGACSKTVLQQKRGRLVNRHVMEWEFCTANVWTLQRLLLCVGKLVCLSTSSVRRQKMWQGSYTLDAAARGIGTASKRTNVGTEIARAKETKTPLLWFLNSPTRNSLLFLFLWSLEVYGSCLSEMDRKIANRLPGRSLYD